MKLSIGKGIYTPIRAFLINDPNHIFFTKHVIDRVMELSFFGQNHDVNKAFQKTLDQSVIEKLEFDTISMDESMTLGCPGYLYLRGCLEDFRATPNNQTIYLEMSLDHVENSRMAVVLYPRRIGYNMDIPASIKKDEVEKFIQQEIYFLVAMSGITSPNELDIPEYIGTDACRFLAYPWNENEEGNV